jgi:hypothetical protein
LQVSDVSSDLMNALFQRATQSLGGVASFPAFGAICMEDGSLDPIVSGHATDRGLESISVIKAAIEVAVTNRSVRGYGICLCDLRDHSVLDRSSPSVVIVIEVDEEVFRAVIPYEHKDNGLVVFSDPQYTNERMGILSDC